MYQVRDAVDKICVEFKLKNDQLTDEEWRKLKVLIDFLKHFYDQTILHSGQLYVTSDLLFPTVISLSAHLRESAKNAYLKKVSDLLSAEMDRRFKKFLDPKHPLHNPFYVGACYFHPCLRLLMTKEQTESAMKFINTLFVKHFQVGVNVTGITIPVYLSQKFISVDETDLFLYAKTTLTALFYVVSCLQEEGEVSDTDVGTEMTGPSPKRLHMMPGFELLDAQIAQAQQSRSTADLVERRQH